MSVKQVSVFLENKPGKLAELTKLLSAENINLRAISVAEAADFGIVRIIVDDVYRATTALKDAGYICSTTDVIAAEVKDEPGALAQMITVLGENNLSIEYMYAITTGKKESAYMIIRVKDIDAANVVLKAAGIRIVTLEELIK